jgi:hypothetical protein
MASTPNTTGGNHIPENTTSQRTAATNVQEDLRGVGSWAGDDVNDRGRRQQGEEQIASHATSGAEAEQHRIEDLVEGNVKNDT